MISLHALHGVDEGPAARLAALMNIDVQWISMHRFPDGESLPTASGVERQAHFYCSLNRPNEKLVETMLVADALRRAGAKHLSLIAPYLPYLRQDTLFLVGQSLSRDVILPILARAFDRIVTIDPHLHRTKRLDEVAPGAQWVVLSGARAIAEGLKGDAAAFDVVVGPDAESRQWLEGVANALNLPFWTFDKERRGDRTVVLTPPLNESAKGARVLIVDDLCASGGTLCATAQALHDLGAAHIEAAITHALFSDADANAMRAAGIARVRSCDGCVHASNAFSLAPLIARSLDEETLP